MAAFKGQAADGLKILPPTDEGVHFAAELLRRGKLVAFGTETVYGLGADATNSEAVRAIYEAKGRPGHNPLILHVDSLEMARDFAVFSPLAERVVERFWPGPLTLVLPSRAASGVSSVLSAGLPTLAIRFPATTVARSLISMTGRPLAAPSANLSGRISGTTASEVIAQLGDRVAAVIDSGPTEIGLESTILGLDGPPRLLRHGAVPLEALEAFFGDLPEQNANAGITAPGQLASHYAPRAAVRMNVRMPQEGEVWVGFGSCPGAALSLSLVGDIKEAAHRLFVVMAEADALSNGGRIAFAPIPSSGLGRAINDRLTRAMAPRPALNDRELRKFLK